MVEPLPTLHDIARVKNEVNVKRRQQQELQPAIQALTIALHGLTSQHERLAREIELSNASIAPIRKLPLETLTNIFGFCALEKVDAPLTLLRVCRRWREAATAPQIWSRIVIDLDDMYAVNRTKVYLERSKSTLLDVELSRPGFTDLGWEAWYHILDHSNRWRTLEISAATYDQVNDILDDLPSFVPHLVHTTLTVEGFFFLDAGHRFEPTMLQLRPDFLHYPKFRSLRLQTWALPAFTFTPGCVLSQLTSLYLTDTYASTFQITDRTRPHPICGNAISFILRFCPCLETFTLNARDSVAHHSGKSCQDPTGVTRDAFILPSLIKISIIAHQIDTFAILNRIILPKLKIVHIEPLPQYSPCLVEKFSSTWMALFRRSKAPPLEGVSVFAMAPADVIWTLERSPRLQQFRLSYCTNPAPILQALASPYAYKGRGKFMEEPRWLSPKLERIYLDECFRIPWRTVARLLQHRHRAYMETKTADAKKLALILDLVINGHDVLENRHLDTLMYLKTRQIQTLIEP
ncbi:hypothetical protein BU17DRAFT_64883 [Hysterangium stoloniferum]|nr:hypothetical protein BU17DRAFT_64883 [Hysterangium stoloniferum]